MSDKLVRIIVPGIMDAEIEVDENDIAAAVAEYLREHPVSGNVDSVNGKTGVVVLTASDVGALPSNTPIPSAVTEQTVAGWGFTKNTGDYSKPSGGIPKTDLASDVQTAIAAAAELPTVTASDNGKFLRVVNGAWAAETVQTWQGGSY